VEVTGSSPVFGIIMENRAVRLVLPWKPSMVRMSISNIPVTRANNSIYDTVDFFRDEIFSKSRVKEFDGQIKKRVLLRDIVNLYNSTGVRDLPQVKSMLRQIKSGEDVFSSDGLPNIKLVKTGNNEWVLFDGHHSMLAYMLDGKEYLDELPHLVVEDGERAYVLDKEIHVFFGKHSAELKHRDWRDYVIDWQAQKENQLQERIQKNMGELLDTLPRNESRLY